ncbi:hypothetical protein TPA0910_64120 [Streptomyces hygroscopicus subsp. sporocinereus]|uniref:IclR-ED domain-containing protein n=1 Tax=Streptomyces hygroscopicus TaxID=1912 RepID=A0ABQ3U8R0_STRHY|nr:hypothetical protein TPA0910_64120 [Streptomyces hygroscopicus]
MPLSAGPLADPDRARGERRHLPRPMAHGRGPRSVWRRPGHALAEQEPTEGLGTEGLGTEGLGTEGLRSLAVPVRDTRGRVYGTASMSPPVAAMKGHPAGAWTGHPRARGGRGAVRAQGRRDRGRPLARGGRAQRGAPRRPRHRRDLRREPLPAPRATAPRVEAALATASAQLAPGAFRTV